MLLHTKLLSDDEWNNTCSSTGRVFAHAHPRTIQARAEHSGGSDPSNNASSSTIAHRGRTERTDPVGEGPVTISYFQLHRHISSSPKPCKHLQRSRHAKAICLSTTSPTAMTVAAECRHPRVSLKRLFRLPTNCDGFKCGNINCVSVALCSHHWQPLNKAPTMQ